MSDIDACNDEMHGVGCLCPTCCERLGHDYYAMRDGLAKVERLTAPDAITGISPRLPVWKLVEGYPVGVALTRLQATADTTQQRQYLLEPDGTEHAILPSPNSPYADLNQRKTEI